MTVNILPPAKTQFLSGNAVPLAGGSVTMYIPSTTTAKTTWQDASATIPNANPIILDANGEALIWGSGAYRQIVKDSLGNLIWDQITQASDFSSVSSFSGTSITSVAIATGAQTFTTQPQLVFSAGGILLIASAADAANYMLGTVTSYNVVTGALVMNITSTGGSGTHADWNISISGPAGPTGTVSTTGSPVSGQLTKFSGSTAITNGDLSGDVTTSGTLSTTVAKIQSKTVSGTTGTTNVVFSASPTITGTVNTDTAGFTNIGVGHTPTYIVDILNNFTDAGGQPIGINLVDSSGGSAFAVNQYGINSKTSLDSASATTINMYGNYNLIDVSAAGSVNTAYGYYSTMTGSNNTGFPAIKTVGYTSLVNAPNGLAPGTRIGYYDKYTMGDSGSTNICYGVQIDTAVIGASCSLGSYAQYRAGGFNLGASSDITSYIGLQVDALGTIGASASIINARGAFIGNMGNASASTNVYGVYIDTQTAGSGSTYDLFCADGFFVKATGDVIVGKAAISTSATTKLFWIPSCAGTPTGAPTAPYTNAAAMVVDTSANKLWVLVGSTWRFTTLT